MEVMAFALKTLVAAYRKDTLVTYTIVVKKYTPNRMETFHSLGPISNVIPPFRKFQTYDRKLYLRLFKDPGKLIQT